MKEIDFESDLKLEIQNLSQVIGFKVSLNPSLDKMLLDYLTVRTKIIEPQKRNILINPEFKNEINRHPKRIEIEKIFHIAKNGGNLNIFQSKKLLQTNFHDHLQNEWNIFHFHLSLKIDIKSKFVKQVDSLLFAYIDKSQVIFLGTDKHKKGIFGDTKWIEILHDHFPTVIAEYKDETILEIYPKLNSLERQTLWNKGYTLGMTNIKGTVYHNPGIGRMTSGHSMGVSKTATTILRWIYKLKEQLQNFETEICNFINVLPENAEFKIAFGDITLELQEKSSNSCLLTFPNIFEEKEEMEKENQSS